MSDTKDAKSTSGFSEWERAALKERAAELKAEQKRGRSRAAGEQAVQDEIAKMSGSDKEIAERFHAVVAEVAPDLDPKTWYGMPAYARAGKVVCFFQGSAKFDARYATIGFNDGAYLDDGDAWPVSYAVLRWTDAVERTVRDLVSRAVS